MHWTDFETWSWFQKWALFTKSELRTGKCQTNRIKNMCEWNPVQHWTEIEINNSTSWLQVHQGGQPRLPPSRIASLACVCMMAARPLHIQSHSYHARCKKGLHTHAPRRGILSNTFGATTRREHVTPIKHGGETTEVQKKKHAVPKL